MRINAKKIRMALWKHLAGGSSFANSVSGTDAAGKRIVRVYWDRAPERATLPYAVINPIDSVQDDTMPHQGSRERHQLSLFDKGDADASNITRISDEFHDRVHDAIISIGGHDRTTLQIEVTRGPIAVEDVWQITADIVFDTHASV